MESGASRLHSSWNRHLRCFALGSCVHRSIDVWSDQRKLATSTRKREATRGLIIMHKLSAETYRMIVKSLRSDTKGRQGEKRKKPRVGLRTKIDIVPRSRAGAKNGASSSSSFTVWLR